MDKEGKRNYMPEFISLSSIWVKIMFMLIFVLVLTCLGLAYSRAAWLGFAFSLLFLGMVRPRMLIYIFLIVAMMILFFFPKMLLERTTSITSQRMFHDSSRFVYWRSAWQIIKDNPITGVGLNAYSEVGDKYFNERKIVWAGYPHNCYLQMMAEIGAVGLFSFLWILLCLFRRGLEDLSRVDDINLRNLLLGAMAGLVGFLVQSFFDTNFYSVKLDSLMWLMIGLIIVIQRIGLNSADNRVSS